MGPNPSLIAELYTLKGPALTVVCMCMHLYGGCVYIWVGAFVHACMCVCAPSGCMGLQICVCVCISVHVCICMCVHVYL